MPSRRRGVLVIAALALSTAPLAAQDATPTGGDLLLSPDAQVASLGIDQWTVRQ